AGGSRMKSGWLGMIFGQVYHDPPPPEELETRMVAMCAFANGETPGFFVHPAVRAIILRFWLTYDHPFVYGNGRTARALFTGDAAYRLLAVRVPLDLEHSRNPVKSLGTYRVTALAQNAMRS
ncbi:MAG TPA: Fic family protein, partial [Terrimicrobiaceae bacterium]